MGITTISGRIIRPGTTPLTALMQDGATTGQAIIWDGSEWAPGTISGGTVSVITGPTTLLSWNLVSGTYTASLINQSAYSWFGNATGSSAAPTFNTGVIPNSLIPAFTGDISNTAGTNTLTVRSVGGVGFSSLTPSQNQTYRYDTNTSKMEFSTIAELQPVLAVSTSNVASLSGTLTVDGIALVAGNRVLLTAQSTASQNGLWTVQSGAWTRPLTYDTGTSVSPSAFVAVSGGTVYANTFWQLTGSTTSITVDTTSTTWKQLFPTATTSVPGLVKPDGSTILISGSTISVAASALAPFPVYGGATAYVVGQVVQGSDGNLYRALGSTSGNDPTADAGVNWELYQAFSPLTLNCGAGSRFAGTAPGTTGGTATDAAGILQCLTFLQHAAAASAAPITIQIANNPTFSASANGSTTTIKTNTNIPIGATVWGATGTAGNINKSGVVSASSLSAGTYTLTVSTLPSSTASGDTFTAAYFYGTNPIAVNLPQIASLSILGSTTGTIPAPAIYPVLADVASGSFVAGNIVNVALTYSFAANGANVETLAGPVTQVTIGTNGHSVNVGALSGLPAAITKVNYYVCSASGGTTMKLATGGSVAPSGGAVGAFNFTNFATGVTPPTTNPNEPVQVQFSGSGFAVNSNNVTVGSMLIKGAAATGTGIRITTGAQNVTVSPATIVSGFSGAILATANSSAIASSVQVDNANNGFRATSNASLTANNSNALSCTTGFQADARGFLGSSSGYAFAASSFAFFALDGGFGTLIPPTGGQSTFATSGTTFSPTVNTVGSANSYISNS